MISKIQGQKKKVKGGGVVCFNILVLILMYAWYGRIGYTSRT